MAPTCRGRPTLLLLTSLLARTAHAQLDGSWTDRLGLRFRDDCQEDVGITGFIVWLFSWYVSCMRACAPSALMAPFHASSGRLGATNGAMHTAKVARCAAMMAIG